MLERIKTPRVILSIVALLLVSGVFTFLWMTKSSPNSSVSNEGSVQDSSAMGDANDKEEILGVDTSESTISNSQQNQSSGDQSKSPQNTQSENSSAKSQAVLDQDMKNIDTMMKDLDEAQAGVDDGFNDKSLDLSY